MTLARLPESSGPWKAAQSYGPADGELFYGRDAESAALAQFLIDRSFGILTASSGMGKTSLLHARVLPILEREGWLAVIARPHEDPLKAMQDALFDHLLPHPHTEAAVLEALRSELALGPVAPLAEAFAAYAALPTARRAQLRLFAPERSAAFTPLPMTSRALRGSIGVAELIEHFEALVADGTALGVTPHTDVAELAQQLRAREPGAFWQTWKDRLLGARGLAEAIRMLDTDWAPLRPGITGMILVVDQFEEVFTRLPAGRVEALMATVGALAEPGARVEGAKPLHVALSLRKEFFADLVPHVQRFGSVERLTFFLYPMTLDAAREALRGPASLVGLTFATEDGEGGSCLDAILSLAADERATPEPSPASPLSARHREDERYAPALISLVGAHLWKKLPADVALPLSYADFRRLVPGLEDVFTEFLEDSLSALEVGPPEALRAAPEAPHTSPQSPAAARRSGQEVTRFDALELLDRLATPAGFRNIMAEEDLVTETPLPPAAVRLLLNAMDYDLKLIRRERRRGGAFVEIMHERLIGPVRNMLTELRGRDILRASLAPARDMLYVLPDEPNSVKDPLPSYFRVAILAYLDRLDLDRVAGKHLLRSMLAAGPSEPLHADGASPTADAWVNAVLQLAEVVDLPRSTLPRRGGLLYGPEIDTALAAASRDGAARDGTELRDLAISALADRTDRTGARISRAFARLTHGSFLQ